MHVGDHTNKQTRKVTVQSHAEKVFPVEESLEQLAVVLFPPGAHQGLLMCLEMGLSWLTPEMKPCTKSLSVLQVTSSGSKSGRNKTADIICDPILYPNASPPSTPADGRDLEGHPGDTFPSPFPLLSISVGRLVL